MYISNGARLAKKPDYLLIVFKYLEATMGSVIVGAGDDFRTPP